MTVQTVLQYSANAALAILMLAMVLVSMRVIRGPTTEDRVLALDQLVAIAIGFIAAIAIRTGFELYADIALAIALVGFIATAAFARYLYIAARSGRVEDKDQEQKGDTPR